jgi:hypothetical protein
MMHGKSNIKEWLHEWLQIGIFAKRFCFNSELVLRKIHSFRLQQMFLWSCDIIENLNISLNCNQSGILRQRTHDVELKKRCVTLLEEFGSLRYTRETLANLHAELRAEVARLGGNPVLEKFLDEMLDWKREIGEKDQEQ